MAITPNQKSMLAVSSVMAETLTKLHRIIETNCDPNKPKETMALMMAFINSITLVLRDKVETLQKGLGNELLAAVNEITQPDPTTRNILDKLNPKILL